MDEKNKENEIIDASASPLFQLANETKEEEQQINNDFMIKKQNEKVITNQEVNQMFNKGTVASDAVNNGTAVTTPMEPVTPPPMEPVNPVPMDVIPPQTVNQNMVNEEPVLEPNKDESNNEPTPVAGMALLFILIAIVVGGFGFNFLYKQVTNHSNKQNTELKDNNSASETKKEEETPTEETKQEETPKQEEPVQEVTNTLNCNGTIKDYGITINVDATIVYKNSELYTIKVIEKSNSLNKEMVDQLAKIAYVGGYSYSTTSDYKTVTMTGSKNTLSKSVKEELGTLDKGQSYYKKMGLKCTLK